MIKTITIAMCSLTGSSRGIQTRGANVKRYSKPLLLGSLAVGTGSYFLYKHQEQLKSTLEQTIDAVTPSPVCAASLPASQPSVSIR